MLNPQRFHRRGPRQGPALHGVLNTHLCAGLLCVSICDVTSWMFMGRPAGRAAQGLCMSGVWGTGGMQEACRRDAGAGRRHGCALTVQGDAIVLLHRLQRIRLPLEMHVRCPEAAARPVIVHSCLLQGSKLCKELLRKRGRAETSISAANTAQPRMVPAHPYTHHHRCLSNHYGELRQSTSETRSMSPAGRCHRWQSQEGLQAHHV